MGSWVSAGLAATVLALLILSPLAAARERLALRRMAEASALTWDRWDRDVRSAGRNPIRDAVAPAMPDVETRMGAARNELHLEGDPGSWKNICAAQYYGVRSVRAE